MLEYKLEAILFFKNEPVSLAELSKLVGASKEEVKKGIEKLQDFYHERGMVIVSDGEEISFGTHPSKYQSPKGPPPVHRSGRSLLARPRSIHPPRQ
jgi:chromosome segregation and condensation protein ScpB